MTSAIAIVNNNMIIFGLNDVWTQLYVMLYYYLD